MSDWFVKFWYVVVVIPVAAFMILAYLWKRYLPSSVTVDRMSLKLPVLSEILEKAAVARWTRTWRRCLRRRPGGCAHCCRRRVRQLVFLDATKRSRTTYLPAPR